MSDGTPRTIEVTIAGLRMTVPVWRDEETTRAIAERVEERIRDIEARSRRVNTQVFATEAAFTFAVEAAKLEAAREHDDQELSETLEHLAKKLRAALQGPKLRKLPDIR